MSGAAADGGERRDPSEKQEPHTVMWGIIMIIMQYIIVVIIRVL